jgi:MFS family permease
VWSILRQRDFRTLWLSQSASVFGDALVIVAIGLFVTRRTHDASAVSAVLAAYALPLVVCLLVGGVVADRVPRRQIMVTADVIRGALHGLLAILIATGAVRLWQMIVIGALYGSAEAFFRPAYTGLIPQTVREADIQSAQALSGLSAELATFVSPALATALLLGVGAAAVFAVDAATFALSASLLLRVHVRQRGATVERAGALREFRDGWQAVRERTWVWATIAGFSVAVFAALAPFFVLGATVGHEVYGSAAVYGWATAAWGAGTVSGVAIGARWRPRRPMFAGVLAATSWPAVIAVFAVGPPLGVLYAVMAAGGIGLGAFQAWWETALAERIPPHLLSRVSAWDWMGSLALLPLGYAFTGPLADAVGARWVMAVGGVIGTAATAAALLPHSTRSLRRSESAPLTLVRPA